MIELKRLILDEETDIEFVESIISENNVQLGFESLDVFKRSFNKFYCILWDYAERIKSLELPVVGNIFEDSVAIISEIEDKLEVAISHIVIDAGFHEDIKQLVDFYYDDLQDGSLVIAIKLSSDEDKYKTNEIFKSPIEVIAYVERNRFPGVTLGIASDCCKHLPWTLPGYYRSSIMPYVSIEYVWGQVKLM